MIETVREDNVGNGNKEIKKKLVRYDFLLAFFMAALMNFAALAFAGALPGQRWRFGGDIVTGKLNGGFWKYLFEGHFPEYRWNVGLGGNTLLSTAYGGMSPFNFIAFLIPDKYVALMLMIILETGVSAMLMQIFIKRVLKLESAMSIILACGYALGTYPTVYFGCLCLNDSVYMLPLVLLALDDFLKRKKIMPLSLVYAYCFICQFYCGFITGVFSFICFVLYLIIKGKDNKKQELAKIISGYVIAGALAVMISMCILYPVIMSYIGDGGSAFNKSEEMRILNPLLMLGASFWGRGIVLSEETPCIYCGMAVLPLSIFFFVNRSGNKKEKLFWGILLIIMILSLFINPLYSFWHIFNRPDGYTARFAIIISFILVSVAARGFKDFSPEEKNGKRLVAIGLVIFLTLVVSYVVWNVTDDRSFSDPVRMFTGNAILIVLWILIFFLKAFKTVKTVYLSTAIVILSVVELTAASYCVLKEYSGKDALEYANVKNAIEDFLTLTDADSENEEAQGDNNSSRTHISGPVYDHGDLLLNQGDWFDYMGVSMYTPAQNGHFLDTFYHMGDGISVAVLTYEGKTDLSDMLLGVKYRGRLTVDDTTGWHVIYDKNDKVLPIGFMVSGDINDFPEFTNDPFDNQNMLASAMAGKQIEIWTTADDRSIETSNLDIAVRPDGSGMISKISDGDVGGALITVPQLDHEHAYVYFSRMSNDGIKVHSEGGRIMDIELQSEGERAGNGTRSIDIYNSLLEMTGAEGMFYCVVADFDKPDAIYSFSNLCISYQNENALNELYDDLSAGGWKEEVFEDGYIKAVVNAEDDKTSLFMSIPYDKYWKAYIDGAEATVKPVVNDTFCSLDMPEGTHTVEMKYVVPGRKTGCIIALFGLIGWLITVISGLMTRFNKNPT